MTLRLTDRDQRIMVKCALCRWLSTSQIRQLYFPKASLNAVQKRLRKLADEGYLRAYRDNPMTEAFFAAGPKGRPFTAERGISVETGSEAPKQIAHLAGINTIRVALETSSLSLAYFFAHWQLGSLDWTFPAIPDAVFATRSPNLQRFLVEYDRGTEPLKALLQKLRSYDQGIPGFVPEAVVLVWEENRCLGQLGRDLRKEGIRLPCLAASLAEIKQTLTEPVFLDVADGTRRSLVTAA